MAPVSVCRSDESVKLDDTSVFEAGKNGTYAEADNDLNGESLAFSSKKMTVLQVTSPNVEESENFIESLYKYDTNLIERGEEQIEGQVNIKVKPVSTNIRFRTDKRVPKKLGLMLVGWGGNNGSTLTATILANKHGLTWRNKSCRNGQVLKANYFGSLTQASTVYLGSIVDTKSGKLTSESQYVPFKSLLPMVDPNENLILDGWDIRSDDLASSMISAGVIDYDLQMKLKPLMCDLKPRKSVFDIKFVAENQRERANHFMTVKTKSEQVTQIREDIKDFKSKNGVDKVIVLWTANTERMCEVREGLNLTLEQIFHSINSNVSEISPSTLFAVASIMEGCTYINGSPQNTFVPGVIELAEKRGVFIAGDDFKSGQTKLKSVLVDFLIQAGLKPQSIVSYNHLGNNDGKNLSAPMQFQSKEISKSSVIDEMVRSNNILYDTSRGANDKPDHCIVIKYIPYVGDSKRAMDEYTSEICMNGHNTLVIHNTCEDSLLAAPLILDLVILAELFERITFRKEGDNGESQEEFSKLNVVLSILSYLCKAPLVPKGSPVVNALFSQRAALENVLKACAGIHINNNMALEHRLPAKFDRLTFLSTTTSKKTDG